MSAGNSITTTITGKPDKPSPDFPLTAHPTGRWCKKIKGKLHYFGIWAKPAEALQRYKDFLDGKPRPKRKKPRHHQAGKPKDFPLTRTHQVDGARRSAANSTTSVPSPIRKQPWISGSTRRMTSWAAARHAQSNRTGPHYETWPTAT